MKRFVQVEPVCPFLGGKPCIRDGWQFDQRIPRPCAFWDEDAPMNDDEPCMILRAVKAIIGEPKIENVPIEVPWDTTEKE